MTIKDIISQLPSKSFAKHTSIIQAGDTPPGIFYLEKGYVKMNSLLSDGREITLNIFKPDSYFPLMWGLSNIRNAFNFQAMTPVLIRLISKDDFSKFIKAHPDLLLDLTNRVLIGLDGLLFTISHILSGTAYQRIIAALLMFSNRFGEKTPSGEIIILPLTHQDIANVAAITRETASLNLEKLRSKGLITQKNHLFIIPNLQKLQSESQTDSAELPFF